MIAVFRDDFQPQGTVADQVECTGSADISAYGSNPQPVEEVSAEPLGRPYRRVCYAILLSGVVLAINVLLVIAGHSPS